MKKNAWELPTQVTRERFSMVSRVVEEMRSISWSVLPNCTYMVNYDWISGTDPLSISLKDMLTSITFHLRSYSSNDQRREYLRHHGFSETTMARNIMEYKTKSKMDCFEKLRSMLGLSAPRDTPSICRPY